MKPHWLVVAEGELGVHETPGPKDTPRIKEYESACTLKPGGDNEPWCSCFVNWCFKQSGIRGTQDARAISWAYWGKEVEYVDAEPGDVVVFEWDSGQHHVALFLDQDDDRVKVVGGNQGGAGEVSMAWHSKDYVINVRRAA
jgi:uncharacterized protein (TIGR02594 family)